MHHGDAQDRSLGARARRHSCRTVAPAPCGDRSGIGAAERADRIDNCDGAIYEGTSAFDDDDGFTEDGGACNDSAAAVNPDAAEIANDIDDDCDGVLDSGDDGGCYSANRNESPWTSLFPVGLVAVWSRRRRRPRRG